MRTKILLGIMTILWIPAILTFSGWMDGYCFEPDHGRLIYTFQNVEIYHHRDGCDRRGKYGLEFQCVEFVNRWLASKGHKNLARTGNADSYFFEAEKKGLIPYANGGIIEPQREDIIVFLSSTQDKGHVAVVDSVGENQLTIVQQNAADRYGIFMSRDNPIISMELKRKDGHFIVIPKPPFSVCLGWCRLSSKIQ